MNYRNSLSAFSNSGGGTLVYGLADPVPEQRQRVDEGGVSLRCKGKSTKEWIEDIIPNLVEFPLKRFNVHVVEGGGAGSQIVKGTGLLLVSFYESRTKDG